MGLSIFGDSYTVTASLGYAEVVPKRASGELAGHAKLHQTK